MPECGDAPKGIANALALAQVCREICTEARPLFLTANPLRASIPRNYTSYSDPNFSRRVEADKERRESFLNRLISATSFVPVSMITNTSRLSTEHQISVSQYV